MSLATWYQRYERWEGLDRALERSPAQAWFRSRAATRLAVLCYHDIEDASAFEAQLERLTRIASPVSLRQVEAAVHEGRPLPPRSVLLTFDDGDRSLYVDGLPLLRAYGVPAVAYVIAGLIGTDEPFWWEGLSPEQAYAVKRLPDAERRRVLGELPPRPPRRQLSAEELRELVAGGVEVGSHTLTHPCLDRCEGAAVEREIEDAHRLLTGFLGAPPTSFAYPNGNFDPRADRRLASLGYRSGFLCDHRLTAPGLQHALRLSRLRVSTLTSAARFETVLSGLQPAVFRTGRGAVSALRRVRAVGR
ncbi:polysaccharide deacetylase family protein [Streptomyces sp. T-3]|nr:polysaccharide deacetylase family protein [Streptomyces sp. T-3]